MKNNNEFEKKESPACGDCFETEESCKTCPFKAVSTTSGREVSSHSVIKEIPKGSEGKGYGTCPDCYWFAHPACNVERDSEQCKLNKKLEKTGDCKFISSCANRSERFCSICTYNNRLKKEDKKRNCYERDSYYKYIKGILNE